MLTEIFRLPEPKLPPFGLLGAVALDSFIITMVSYTISMSMALIFAQKLNYEIDSNQELFAQVKIIKNLSHILSKRILAISY